MPVLLIQTRRTRQHSDLPQVSPGHKSAGRFTLNKFDVNGNLSYRLGRSIQARFSGSRLVGYFEVFSAGGAGGWVAKY